jgi:hypothetical protein
VTAADRYRTRASSGGETHITKQNVRAEIEIGAVNGVYDALGVLIRGHRSVGIARQSR